MAVMRALVCSAALAVALAPLAAFAADTSPEHAQAELANTEAQWNLAQQQVSDLQQQANMEAANARTIAVLRSTAMRERQLDLVSNATALEQLAASLANAARAGGDESARNVIAIAQIKASVLVTQADSSLANAMALGRSDEIANAQARSDNLHQLANFLTGQSAEMDISNAKLIAEAKADAIHTPAIAQEQNSIAMGANELLAADTALQAGELNAVNVTIGAQSKGSAILANAQSALQNAKVRAGVAP